MADDPTLRALREVVGDTGVLTDPEVTSGYATDWTGRWVGATPAVVRPRSTEEVAAVVGVCRRTGTPLVPQGGNTGLVGGSVPHGGELVLSTERMVGVEDVDSDAGQLTAWAGTTLIDVQAAASDAGWRYAVDFAARDSATIGGSIATNAGGLRVVRFGATRRHVLGVEAVLGTGEVVSRLGGLVKDNTGFDLAGLLCGSEGTLGIVCRARLSLVPPAGETATALVGFDSLASAVAAVGRVRRAVPGLEAAEFVLADGAALVAEQTGVADGLRPFPPAAVVFEAVGPPDPTEALAAAVHDLPGVGEVAAATEPGPRARLWHVREAHTESIARVGVPIKYDVTLPLPRLAPFCDGVRAGLAVMGDGLRVWLFGHLADGNVHVNVTGVPDDLAERVDVAVLGAVIAAGGSVSAEHGIGVAKRGWLEQDRSPGDVAAMRAIKGALDPDGILNPAVLVGD